MTQLPPVSPGTEPQTSVPGATDNDVNVAALQPSPTMFALQSMLAAMQASLDSVSRATDQPPAPAASPVAPTVAASVPGPSTTPAPSMTAAPAAGPGPVFLTRGPWIAGAMYTVVPTLSLAAIAEQVTNEEAPLCNALALGAVSGVSRSAMKSYKTQALAIAAFNEMLQYNLVLVVYLLKIVEKISNHARSDFSLANLMHAVSLSVLVLPPPWVRLQRPAQVHSLDTVERSPIPLAATHFLCLSQPQSGPISLSTFTNQSIYHLCYRPTWNSHRLRQTHARPYRSYSLSMTAHDEHPEYDDPAFLDLLANLDRLSLQQYASPSPSIPPSPPPRTPSPRPPPYPAATRHTFPAARPHTYTTASVTYHYESPTQRGTTTEWSIAGAATQGVPGGHVHAVPHSTSKKTSRKKKAAYVVFCGRQCGIFYTWHVPHFPLSDTRALVSGVPNCIFRGYSTTADARAALAYAEARRWTRVCGTPMNLPIISLPQPVAPSSPCSNPLNGPETLDSQWYIVYRGISPGVYCSHLECQLNMLGIRGSLHESVIGHAATQSFFSPTAQELGRRNPVIPLLFPVITTRYFWQFSVICMALRYLLRVRTPHRNLNREFFFAPLHMYLGRLYCTP
ncbi:hypothetical protein B0H17DRAFT_1132328 [Mycena rosella]|uniref:Ribonuclease H1 N-terminal domain-containing protein n=1 Tax=Mycena rosella TaxID=1033263 RepID=A0AAD7DLD1_MYCRO|nr:hypothetical protein B0H17DRAFT_1132328 [Mycena rosella]